ncbi:MAG: hypothetical protein KDE31_37925, partial [Caldilineaceae bacterium]|nr:hypothetical protein [Caldilineaceae bacterium]
KTVPATPGVPFYFTIRRYGPILHSFALRHLGRKTFDGLEAGRGYKIAETLPAGWAQSSATCNDGSLVTNVHVREGTTVTCTFINVQLGKLIVKQVTVPANDSNTTFSFTAGGGLSPTSFSLGNGETRTFTNLMPGTNYQVSGLGLPGWALSSATCSNGSSIDRITIDPGQTVTCTFTATQLGKLIVHKATNPNPDLTGTQFQFNAGGGLTPTSFALRNNETATFANLTPRTGYTIAEQNSTNWRLATATCDNNSSPGNIRIDPGQTVNCIFTNEATDVDLALTMTDNDAVAEPGDTIVYTLQYQNSGNQDATNAVITMQVPQLTTFAGPEGLWDCVIGAPAGTQCTYAIGTLSGGVAAGQVQFKVRVDNPTPATATAISSSAVLGYSVNSQAVERNEQTPLKVIVGINLQKDDGGLSTGAGGLITYTLTYANSGNQMATAVMITETVPTNTIFVGPEDLWSCPKGSSANTTCIHTAGTVNAGTGGIVPFIIQVADTLPSGIEVIENSASIGSGTEPHSDIGTEVTEVSALPDLVVRLTSNNSSVSPGEFIRYRISYSNQGNQGAANVQLTTLLPPHTQLDAGHSDNRWHCADTTCHLVVGVLASGSSEVADF